MIHIFVDGSLHLGQPGNVLILQKEQKNEIDMVRNSVTITVSQPYYVEGSIQNKRANCIFNGELHGEDRGFVMMMSTDYQFKEDRVLIGLGSNNFMLQFENGTRFQFKCT